MYVKYRTTNENLTSIVLGLDPKPEDFILAIGGSGDQGFALIGAGEGTRVLALDSDKFQVDYMRRNQELIRKGEFKKFLRNRTIESKKKRIRNTLKDHLEFERESGTKYFTREKLEEIRNRIENIIIEEGEIFSRAKEGGFSKAYLSNAVTYPQKLH